MTPPAARAQIVVSPEEFEEILGHALVDVKVGAKCGIKALNGAGGAVTMVQQPFDRIQQGVGLGAEQRLKSGIGTGEQTQVVVSLPIPRALVAR